MWFIGLFLALLFSSLSCDSTEPPPIVPPPPPPPDYRNITLTVEDISYTEALINIQTDSINFPASITLLKNTNEEKFILINSDTTVYVDSLLPNTNYTFQAALTGDTIKSDTIKAKTLEPTSHNFTWTTWEFGTHSSSALYDVAIIDENNIWAVGEIYMNDSLGNPDSKRYNSAIWNGNEWDIKRIPYNYQGTDFINPIQSVFVFAANDIWFCGNGVIHWDGSNYVPISIPTNVWGPYQMNKLWGSSNNDLYIVGNGGNIAHYENGVWTKIESGTDLDLTDIYGDSEGNLYAAGVNIAEIKGVVVKGDQSGNWSVMIEGDIIDESELFDKLYGSLTSIWADDNNTIYTGGNLLYQYKDGEWDYVRSLPENFINGNPGTYYRGYIYEIDGNAANDWIIVGDRNTLKHFSGVDWAQLGEPYDPGSGMFWRGLDMNDNTIVVVGDKGIKARIMVLKR